MNTNTSTIDKGFTVHTTKMADGTYEAGIFEVEPYLITPRQRQYTIEKVYRITALLPVIMLGSHVTGLFNFS